jgi:hypothetical protein
MPLDLTIRPVAQLIRDLPPIHGLRDDGGEHSPGPHPLVYAHRNGSGLEAPRQV